MIEKLCERVFLFQHGHIVKQGDAKSVIQYYASSCSERASVFLAQRTIEKEAVSLSPQQLRFWMNTTALFKMSLQDSARSLGFITRALSIRSSRAAW